MSRLGWMLTAAAVGFFACSFAGAGADSDWKEFVYDKQGVKFSLPKAPEVTDKDGKFAAIGQMSDCIALVMVNEHPAGSLLGNEDQHFDKMVGVLGKNHRISKDRKVKVNDKHLGRSLTMVGEKTEKLLRMFVVGDRLLIVQVSGFKGFLAKSRDLRKFVNSFDLLP